MSNTDRIRAYYNLHRKCFSVQDYQTGLVTEHTDMLFVTNAMFVVRESGNKKVKREGRKNVHAFVNGIRQPKWIKPTMNYQEVLYNPYTMEYFQYKRCSVRPCLWPETGLGIELRTRQSRPNAQKFGPELLDRVPEQQINKNQSMPKTC